MNDDSSATLLMQSISQELGLLQSSILQRDLSAIEMHTHRTREMLTELRPILGCVARSSPEFLELRDSVRGCASLVNHVRRAVRSLINLYRIFSDGSVELLGESR